MPVNILQAVAIAGYEFMLSVACRRKQATLVLLMVAAAFAGCAQPGPVIEPTPLKAIEKTAAAPGFKSLWSATIGDEDVRGVGSFVPFVDNTDVYTAAVNGIVTRLDLANGKRPWRRDLKVRLSSGVGGDGKHVYVASRDGVVFALDKKTGETAWTQSMSSEVLVRPVTAQTSLAVIAGDAGDTTDELVVVRASNGVISALDSATGEQLWNTRFEPPALTLHGYSEPLVLRSGILAGLEDGKLVALSRDRGQLLWESTVSYPSGRSEVERLVDIDANLLTDATHIYAVTYQGELARIEPQRGQLTWSESLSSVAGMAQDDEHLYITLDDSQVVAVGKSTGEVLWRQDALIGRALTRPTVITGKRIVVADFEGYLHALDAATGRVLGRKQAGDSPAGKQLVSVSGAADEPAGTVIMQNREARVFVLRVQ